MSSLLFWNQWVKDYRYLWYALASCFVITMAFMWYSYFRGPDATYHWQKLQEQKVLNTTVHNFRLGPFEIDVPAESYVVLEYLNGSQAVPNTASSYFYLIVTAIVLTVLITLITTAERLWYYAGMGLFIVLIVTLQFETLGIFGWYYDWAPAIPILLYTIPAFYFNRFNTTVPLVTRLITFASITIGLGILIYFFAWEVLPFYHLVITSFPATLILSVIFMIMVAHEIYASFIYIVSQGGSKSLQHFLILFAVYFANVVLTLFHEVGLVTFDFVYINLFLLLSVSAILGIWGFGRRESQYENVVQFYPYGALMFLALGALCFTTIGHNVSNANDPAVVLFRHGIIITHAGYGLAFFLYILSNFGQILADNGPVYKVLYNPRRMPYFTYRLAGFVAVIATMIATDWKQYVYNSFSGFYNYAGDFHRMAGNDEFARTYYRKSSTQAFQNHRSNYTLALMSANGYDFEKAHDFMEAANGKRPTQYSLTNAGNLFMREGNVRGAIDEYKKNIIRDPDLAAALNNIGVGYIKLRNYDSALVYLSRARETSLTKTSAETNFFALAALETIPIDADSIYKSFNNPSTATLSNVYALAALLGSKIENDSDPLAETDLNLYSATLLNNYIIRHAKDVDTTFTNRAYAIASDSLNAGFSEALKASLAFAFYHQGNVSKALEILAEQVYLSQSYQGKFNYTMGLWALEQGNPELAASYFSFADTYDYKDAPFYHAIAITETGHIPQALMAWDSVLSRGDRDQKAIAANIKRILSVSTTEAINLPDGEKYQFLRYRVPVTDSLQFNRIVSTFSNDNYKAQSFLDYSQKYYKYGYLIPAIRYYQKISGLQLTDKKLYNDIRYFELKLLASRREVRSLANQINEGLEFGNDRFLEKIYYTALINEASGDSANAVRNYKVLARYNPYFEDGIIAASIFAKQANPRSFDAYNILADAIQVNGNSIRLLEAYYREALDMGLDEFAASSGQRLMEIRALKGLR